MKKFNHPFIVNIIDDFIDSDGYLYIVQELYPDGDFQNYLEKREGKLFSEEEILRFLANIFKVVFDINSRNIYHRDLKPANFLIKRDKDGRIYLHLNDFGTAKSSIIDEDRINTSYDTKPGTLAYMAPEIISATTENPDMTKQDVWAVGIIAYEICTFNLPFKGGSGALINAIINSPHIPIAHQDYSAELKGLIDQLLTKDPTKRPSV